MQHTVEENVARLSAQRAAAMDMSAAVPAHRSSSGGGAGAGGGEGDLTVRDVAALLSTRWRETGTHKCVGDDIIADGATQQLQVE